MVVAGQDQSFEGSLGSRVIGREGIGRAHQSLGQFHAGAEPTEQSLLAGLRRNKMKRVNPSRLPDAIDAANPLLEPHGVPGQLQVDYDA